MHRPACLSLGAIGEGGRSCAQHSGEDGPADPADGGSRGWVGLAALLLLVRRTAARRWVPPALTAAIVLVGLYWFWDRIAVAV